MNKLTHEQFDKMWEDSTKEEVLFQFYYDYYKKVEVLDRIDKVIEYCNETIKYMELLEEGDANIQTIKEVINILKGSEE